MEFFRRAAGRPSRLGILPGTFNPVTVAHVALAQAALPSVDEVVFVLPRTLPHKEFFGASFRDRVEMLLDAAEGEERFSIAAAGGGLFAEIARECRAAYGADAKLTFLCGRDAAERIVMWDYGRSDALAGMLREFDLLVAARAGEFEAPPGFPGAFARLPLAGDVEKVSATEVRRRIARGEPWQHLVPAPVRERAHRIYGLHPSAGR
jgi:nicotinate-nucleotide adenylyltransferase